MLKICIKLLRPSIKKIAITGIVKSKLYLIVKSASIAPIAYEPLSPKNTFAGLILKTKKVVRNVSTRSMRNSIELCPYLMYSRYARKRKAGIAIPVAKPSIPSVMLKEFNIKARGIAKIPASMNDLESRSIAMKSTKI